MKNVSKYFIQLILLFAGLPVMAQTYKIEGQVRLADSTAAGATISLRPCDSRTTSDTKGYFAFNDLKLGNYSISVSYLNAKAYRKQLKVSDADITIEIKLEAADADQLSEVTVKGHTEKQASGNLMQVEGTAIYAGKKTEVINIAQLTANLATNNTRQIYSRVAGINIIEYDGGGLQLGIGGRGLNPSRVSNFNTRQNGYDISADALGYPESYYTPTREALERVEIIRGAASLQYGTQFGGLINFQMKKALLINRWRS